MCALKISAEDTTNPDNNKSTTPEIEGRFPGTVCFYRSEKQREHEYGSNEDKNNIPTFGFDIYIPKLYGKEDCVTKEYKVEDYKDKIMTAYTASVKSKKGAISDVNVRLYPAKDEWVEGEWKEIEKKEKKAKKDKKPIQFKDRKECKYYPSWINPTATSMSIYVDILFPEEKNLTDGDDFIEFKKNPISTTEIIYFKIVKVDDSWNPAERTKWNDTEKKREKIENLFVGLSENEPLFEQEKKLYASQITELKAKRGTLTEEDQNLETEYGSNTQTITEMTTPWTKEERDKEIVENTQSTKVTYITYKNNPTATQKNKDEADAKVKKIAEENEKKRKEINEKYKQYVDKKQHPEKYDQARYDSLTSRQTDIRNRRSVIKTDLQLINQDLGIKETLYNENTYRLSDNSLELGNPNTHTFTFKPEKSRNCHTSITITRKQNAENIKAALIAYYIRSEKVKDKDGTEKSIDKEFIIGQINILPLVLFKTIDQYCKADSYATSFNMPIYFNPVPLHFVKVTTKKDTEKNATDWNVENTLGISLDNLTRELGKYTNQAGIKVRNLWQTGMLELIITEKDGKKKLKISSTDFPLDDKSYVDSKVGNISVDSEIKKVYSQYILNNYLYDNSAGTPLNETVAGSSSCPKHKLKFKNFLKDYPQLRQKKDGLSEPIITFNLAKAVADFLVDNIYIIFMMNDITGSDGNHTKTQNNRTITEIENGAAAYTFQNSNRIFMFKKAMKNQEDLISTLIHELGHSLGLPHTFYHEWKMFPEKVSFDGKWHEKIAAGSLTADRDYKGYGATYDNIMDYGKDSGSGNSKFHRRIFSKRQWITMNESLINKSKDVYRNLSDAGVFKYLDESSVKEEDRISFFIGDKQNKDSGYTTVDFIQNILNLGMAQTITIR